MSENKMITSKDIINKTNISRATLNNYIKLGILPKPVVGPPREDEKGAKQIGYFPEDVLIRLDRVKLMKSQGKTMEQISAFFQSHKDVSSYPVETKPIESKKTVQERRGVRPHTRITDRELRVTICDLKTPAYLVNHNFEIEWINKPAEEIVFRKKVRSLVDTKDRNIFRLFLDQRGAGYIQSWEDIVSVHLTVLQRRINEMGITGICTNLQHQESDIFKKLFDTRLMMQSIPMYRLPLSLQVPGDGERDYLVYTMCFREGTFIVFIPDEGIGDEFMTLLGHRERVIKDLLKHKMPSLVSLCVLVADLQDSTRISAELLPGQYFELINGLWEVTGPVFDKYNGIYGKHVGDGVLYYFLDKPGDNYINNCINCAIDLREIVIKFSEKWKGIKGWDNELYLNTGINEGQEFFGAIRSANNIEFTALGDTINTAGRLSEFSRDGQIWTTKNLISKLSQEELNMFRFGVHKQNNRSSRLIRDSFARVADLIPEENLRYNHFCNIAGLPITEIKERIKPIQVS